VPTEKEIFLCLKKRIVNLIKLFLVFYYILLYCLISFSLKHNFKRTLFISKLLSKIKLIKRIRVSRKFILRLSLKKYKNCLRNALAKFIILNQLDVDASICFSVIKKQNKLIFHAEVIPKNNGPAFIFTKR